jgi:hypothetical protein
MWALAQGAADGARAFYGVAEFMIWVTCGFQT